MSGLIEIFSFFSNLPATGRSFDAQASLSRSRYGGARHQLIEIK